MKTEITVSLEQWNRLQTEHRALREALENLVADWERVHGPIPQDHEAHAAIAKAKGA